VLRVNSKAAFELLLKAIKADHEAMENCGDHDWEVQCALKRAAELLVEAGKGMPQEEAAAVVKELMANDGYGVQRALTVVLAEGDGVQ
jgi:hypothetical protein